LPAVSKAILKVVNGLSKFFDEASKARKIIERTKKIIEDAREARRPKLGVCPVGLAPAARTATGSRAAGAGSPAAGAPAAALQAIAMVAAAEACRIDHVGQVGGDYVNKGPHVNMAGGSEVSIEVDQSGRLIGRPINANGQMPTDKHIAAAIDTLNTNRAMRTALLRNTEAALDQAKAGVLGIKDPNMIVRMKKLCYQLKKLGTD
jgi:hypothetical protein